MQKVMIREQRDLFLKKVEVEMDVLRKMIDSRQAELTVEI